MKTLFKIGKITGAILVVFGLFYFIVLDKIIKNPLTLIALEDIVFKVMVTLSIVMFSCAVGILVLTLFRKEL